VKPIHFSKRETKKKRGADHTEILFFFCLSFIEAIIAFSAGYLPQEIQARS